MKKDLKTKVVARKIKKPNPFVMGIVRLVLGFLNRKYKVKFSRDYSPKALKGKPTILLASHSSRLEFIYMAYGFKRWDINLVCGFQNVLEKGLFRIMLSLGVISKYLYQPDMLCVKHMLGVLKRNGAIGLFPEGIQSTSGSTHPINPATAQFIKRSRANVVVATSKGAFLATNRYSRDRKKGRISIDYTLLFTPEKLETLSEKQIYDLILEKISYNDFEFNKTARNKYVGKKPNAYGIDKILYKCSNCDSEHELFVDNDTIKCKNCGFSVKVNEYYDLVNANGKCFDDIDEWYKWQRSCVRKEILSNDFALSLSGTLSTIRLDKLKKSPKDRVALSVGKATLTKHGLKFSGTLNGKDANFEFDAKHVYSLTYSIAKGFLEFYVLNDYFMLVPDDKDKCYIKWTLASEEIHNLYDEKWRLACLDVYGTQKEKENE